jgi:hypothetical protein
MLAMLTWCVVVGLCPDIIRRNPATPAEGIVCQVYQPPGEPAQARGAVVVPFPLEEVWAVVTDYEHYGDVCSSIHGAAVTYDPGGPTMLTGQGDTLLRGRMPFRVQMDYERRLDRWTVTWTGDGGKVDNRGRWVLTPTERAESLVELEQDVCVDGIQPVFIRTFLMPRMRQSLALLCERLENGPGNRSW